ncbi:hypothetical protein VTI74DRAFT_7383 [Chaetomium olivicolor]
MFSFGYWSGNGYEVNNNNWGKSSATSGSQCTYVDSSSSSGVSWHTTWTWEGSSGKVKSYAYSGRQIQKGHTIASISSMQTSVSWSYEGNDIRANVAYDIFTAEDPNHSTSSGDYEVMIWLANLGNVSPIGSSTGTVSVAGGSWNLHVGNNGAMKVYTFVATSTMSSFSTNVKEFFDYLKSNEGFPADTQNLIGAEQSAEKVDLESRQLSIADLDGEHRQQFERAISRVLSTELAEVTLIKGIPLTTHEELCPGMLDKAREFRDGFQPEILTFDSEASRKSCLLHGYRACAPGSRGFKTRLIEMVAVAVHQIAAIPFELDTSVHKHDGITDWAPPKSDSRRVADMVGYWAEARILGGVVLFDRRNPEAEPGADPNAVCFHSDRQDVTYRIYQLLPEQRTTLLNFLIADEPPSASPLPILGDQNNRIRVDPEEPIQTTGIYRNIWERKDLSPDDGDARLRDVWNRMEYPTMDDYHASRDRAFDRKWGVVSGENI